MDASFELDEPRFRLLDIGRDEIIASIGDPNNQSEETPHLRAAAASLKDDDVEWIAANIENFGGAGIIYDSIGYMLPPPNQEYLTFCRKHLFDGRRLLFADAVSLDRHFFGRLEWRLSDEEIAAICERSHDPSLERERRFPVYLLTRAQLIDLFGWFGPDTQALWQTASDEELHRLCALLNAGIHSGDDTGDDIFSTFYARLEHTGDLSDGAGAAHSPP